MNEKITVDLGASPKELQSQLVALFDAAAQSALRAGNTGLAAFLNRTGSNIHWGAPTLAGARPIPADVEWVPEPKKG